MKRIRVKRELRTIASIIALVLITIALIGGISFVVRKAEEDKKRIYPIFAVGGLSANGQYVESKESIYTKNLIECDGLRTTLSFNNTVKYSIYFYDENEDFIVSENNLSGVYEKRPEIAKYCRIEISPIEDNDIKWHEVSKYANQLKIEVNKEQSFKQLYSVEKENFMYNFNMTNLSKVVSLSGYNYSKVIDLGKYEALRIYVKDTDKTTAEMFIHIGNQSYETQSHYGLKEETKDIITITALSRDLLCEQVEGYTIYELSVTPTMSYATISTNMDSIFVFGR